MAEKNKMICPQCGVEMNHHGDKLIYTTDPHDATNPDAGLGGVIEEFHCCPRCGSGGARRV